MIASRTTSRLLCVALVFVTACAPEKPRDKRPPKVASRPINQAPPPQLEPLPVEPTAPAPAPALEPAAVMSQWWCLCYRREAAEGPEPVTACRELESQCRKLEQRVGKGNDEIIAGSLMQACRSITGSHPGDVAGTREQWQPSALPGAWVSEGACLLFDATPEIAGETGEPSEPAEQADPFAFMHSELIGDIAIGHDSATIRHGHGQPQSTGPIEEMGATGEFEQTWTFADGLSLIMTSTTHSGPQQVGGVIVEAPSSLSTRRGIVVGSEREAVERAYGDVREQDGEDEPNSFTAGSTYGGLHFTFDERGTVTRIFLGAAAE
jgi:hypothetical protein